MHVPRKRGCIRESDPAYQLALRLQNGARICGTLRYMYLQVDIDVSIFLSVMNNCLSDVQNTCFELGPSYESKTTSFSVTTFSGKLF